VTLVCIKRQEACTTCRISSKKRPLSLRHPPRSRVFNLFPVTCFRAHSTSVPATRASWPWKSSTCSVGKKCRTASHHGLQTLRQRASQQKASWQSCELHRWLNSTSNAWCDMNGRGASLLSRPLRVDATVMSDSAAMAVSSRARCTTPSCSGSAGSVISSSAAISRSTSASMSGSSSSMGKLASSSVASSSSSM